MPKYYFTTDDGMRVEGDDEGMELPDEVAAKDEAQNALVDIVREKLPNGPHADFSVTVRDEAGADIYLASMKFDGHNPHLKADADALASEEAADQVSAAINGP